MNPGLIPPADVAAAAKRGLELREKFAVAELLSEFIERRDWRNVGRYRCETSWP